MRPNKIYTNRSASESSTSASEASTVVPSESSVDTERIGGGAGTEGEEEEEEGDEGKAEARMDMLAAAQPGTSNGDHDMGEQDEDEGDVAPAAAGSSNSGARTPGAKSVPLPAMMTPHHQQSAVSPTKVSRLQPFPSEAEGAFVQVANNSNSNILSTNPSAPAGTTHKRHNSRTREWTAQQREQLQRESGYEAEHDEEGGSAGSSPSRAAQGAESTVLEDGDTIMAD